MGGRPTREQAVVTVAARVPPLMRTEHGVAGSRDGGLREELALGRGITGQWRQPQGVSRPGGWRTGLLLCRPQSAQEPGTPRDQN